MDDDNVVQEKVAEFEEVEENISEEVAPSKDFITFLIIMLIVWNLILSTCIAILWVK